VFDHGFLYGEGVYEVLRTYNGGCFLVDRHFKRLRASASMITLDVGVTDSALEGIVLETIAAYRQATAKPRGAGDPRADPGDTRHRRDEL